MIRFERLLLVADADGDPQHVLECGVALARGLSAVVTVLAVTGRWRRLELLLAAGHDGGRRTPPVVVVD